MRGGRDCNDRDGSDRFWQLDVSRQGEIKSGEEVVREWQSLEQEQSCS